MGNFKSKGFFLSNEQVNKMQNFSVDLYHYATDLLAQRGDFTLEELLNFAFAKEYRNQINILRQIENGR